MRLVIPRPQESWTPRYQQEVNRAIEDAVNKLASPMGRVGYGYDGTLTETRSFDVNAATLDDVRQVLATLIVDMKAGGRLG